MSKKIRIMKDAKEIVRNELILLDNVSEGAKIKAQEVIEEIISKYEETPKQMFMLMDEVEKILLEKHLTNK